MGADKSRLERHGTERAIQEDLYARCRDGGHPREHTPRVVLVVHPLLSAQGLAVAMVNAVQHNLFVQSSGVARTGEALADAIYGIMQEHQSVPAGAVDLTPLAGGLVSDRTAQRVEQLAARLALVDKGTVFVDAAMYVAMLHRLPGDMADGIAAARDTLDAAALEAGARGEDDPDWYVDGARDAPEVHTTIEPAVPPNRADLHRRHQTALASERFFVSGAAPASVPQVEVFAHSAIEDDAFAEVISSDALNSGMCGALQRTELMLQTALYTPARTLYVVVDLSAEYMRWAMAATFEAVAASYQQVAADALFTFMARYIPVITNGWANTLSKLYAQGADAPNVLTLHFDDSPVLARGRSGLPSSWFRDYWAERCHNIVVSATMFFLHDVVRGVHRSGTMENTIEDDQSTEHYRRATIACDGTGKTTITVRPHVASAMTGTVERNASFLEFFDRSYNESTYARQLDARINLNTVLPDRRGYCDLSDNAEGTLLLQPESATTSPRDDAGPPPLMAIRPEN